MTVRRCLTAVLAVVVAVVGLSPAVALAQPLADRVPEDAVLYVGWRGSESMGPAYEGSHLKAVLDASELPRVFSEFLPQIIEKIRQKEPQAAEMMTLISTIGGPMWRHPCAFYFGGVDFTNPGMPLPRVGLICDAGADAASLLEQINRAAAPLQGIPVPLKVSNYNGLVAVTLGRDDAFDALLGGPAAAKAGPSLSANAAFKQTMAQLGAEPAVAVYLDNEALMKLIDQGVAAEQDPQAMRMWPMTRDALNLNGIQRIAYAGGFDGKDWTDQVFVAAPAPRKGVAALLDTKPLSQDILRAVPKSATLAGAGYCDAARLLSEIRDALASIDPRGQQQFDQSMAMARQMLGVDLQQDLLQSLGAEWAFYADPNIGGNGMLGWAFVNRLRDPVKAQEALARLEQSANAMIRQQMRNSEVTIALEQTKVGDLTVHYLAFPVVTPAWAIRDGNLYVAFYPQVVVGAAQHVAGKGPSILDNEQFTALRARLGGESASGFQYADLPRTAANGYVVWLTLSRYMGMGDLFGVRSPVMAVPPLSAIQPHLAPAGSVSWTDDAGWHARAVSPFPGSTSLSADPISGMVISQQAVMASVLLPSISRARETANKVKCASNMRQIGMGIMLYANEKKGQFPPDLGMIVQTQAVAPEVFLCPDTRTRVPVDVRGAGGERLAQWVNENSDYVYVGKGLTNTTADAERIVLYEKPQNHGHDGMNLLYGDGHVEFVQMDVAMRMIEQLNAETEADEEEAPAE